MKYTSKLMLNGQTYKFKEEPARELSSHTLVYLPFDTDLLDHSGKNVSFTQGGTNLSIVNGVADFDGGYLYINTPWGPTNYPTTISVRINLDTIPSVGEYDIMNSNTSDSRNGWNLCIMGLDTQNPGALRLEVLPGGPLHNSVATTANTWYHIAAVVRYGNSDFYINGTHVGYINGGHSIVDRLGIGTNNRNDGDIGQSLFDGKMSELIIEDIEWDESKVERYYNKTKSLYGIS